MCRGIWICSANNNNEPGSDNRDNNIEKKSSVNNVISSQYVALKRHTTYFVFCSGIVYTFRNTLLPIFWLLFSRIFKNSVGHIPSNIDKQFLFNDVNVHQPSDNCCLVWCDNKIIRL